jgi:hypothetical protein
MARKKGDPTKDAEQANAQSDLEAAPAENSLDAAEKKKKVKQPKKAKPVVETLELPFMVELAFTFSAILLLAVNLAVVVVSFLSGATLLDIFIRVLATTGGMGLILWLFTWQFSTGALQGAMALRQEEMDRAMEKARASLSENSNEHSTGPLADMQA